MHLFRLKIFFIILPVVFAFNDVSSKCVTVNNGIGNDPGVSINYAGISAAYGYQYESSIFTNAEMGYFGTINSVGLKTTQAVSIDIPVKIYMRNTSATAQTLNTWPNVVAGATLVFDGLVNLSSLGWNYVTLDTPFDYNSGNFEILFECTYGTSLGISGAPQNEYFDGDGSMGKPPFMSQSWISFFPTSFPSNQQIRTERPLIRFGFNENVTWNGGTTDWDLGSNWSTGLTPCFCDNVTIPVTSNDPVIGSSVIAECNSININSGVDLEIGNTLLGDGSFNIHGDLLNNGNILHTSDLYTVLNGVSSTLGGSGAFAYSGEVCQLEISENGNYTLSSDINTLHYFKIKGQLNLDSYTCQVYDLGFESNSIISLNTGTLEVANDINYSFGGDLIFDTGTIYFNSGDPDWVALGLNAGNQTVNGFFYYNLNIRTNNGYEVTIGDGSSVAISNDLTIENPDAAGGVASSVEEIRINGDVFLANSGNSLTFNLGDRLYNNAGFSSFTMGSQAANAINITYSSATEDAIENLGALNFFGTVTYNSNSTQRILAASYNNFSIAGLGTRNMNDPVVIAGNLDFSGGVFNSQGYDMNLAGDWTNTGTTFNPGGTTVYLDGSVQQEVSKSGPVSILDDSFSSLSNWTEIDVVGSNSWAIGNGSGVGGWTANSGGSCAYFQENNYNGSQSYLYYDLPSYTDMSISYSFINPEWTPDVDYFYCEYFNGSSWVNLNTQTTSNSSWTSATHSIPNGATRVRFYGFLGYGYGIGVDDVSISGINPVGVVSEGFDNLSCSNSSGILFSSPVKINTLLALNSGDITTSSVNYLEFDEDATVSGASDASHVVGPVRKLTNATQQFIFPIGNGSEYKASSITPSSTTATTWSSEYFASTPRNNSSVTGAAAGLDHVFTDFYWDISRVSGTANGFVGLYWNSNSGVDVPSELVVSHYNTVGAVWEKVGTTPVITGNASAGNILADEESTSFSPFTLGSGTGNNGLPIDLLSFSADCVSEGVEINFSVASQVNNEFFIIERSENAIDWVVVDQINGVEGGNSNSEMNYQLTDNDNYNGLSYYRLKQQDFDGVVKEFSPVSVSCIKPISEINVYPNPTSSILNLEFEFEDFNNSEASIEILDARGVLVSQYSAVLNRGFNRLTFDCSKLTKGVYFIHLKTLQSVVFPHKLIVR